MTPSFVQEYITDYIDNKDVYLLREGSLDGYSHNIIENELSGELLTKRKGTYYVLSLRENKKMKNHELAMDALIDLEEEKGKLEKEIKQCSGM